MGRASMRREHTTSLARCEGARGSPGAHPGQTCSAHRLAATSRSLTTAALRSVPFARAVVIVRRRKLDGVMETVGLHDPVKTEKCDLRRRRSAPSSDQMRARQRYRGDSRYVAAAFIGAFFPPDPLALRGTDTAHSSWAIPIPPTRAIGLWYSGDIETIAVPIPPRPPPSGRYQYRRMGCSARY